MIDTTQLTISVRYLDPRTGFTVFTTLAAERRGRCCGRGCRHCPFGHVNVPLASDRKAPLPEKPTLLKIAGSRVRSDKVNLLFWSGGKDSFLTYLQLRKVHDADVVFITTFDPTNGNIPEQNVHLNLIFDQAKALKTDLIAVPSRSGNEDYLAAVFEGIKTLEIERKIRSESISLCFGDLHLQDIREWREAQFAKAGYKCDFPIFKVPYDSLALQMFGEDASSLRSRYFFSAVNQEIGFNVGDEITANVMKTLLSSSSFDAFGECGEFHTAVRFG